MILFLFWYSSFAFTITRELWNGSALIPGDPVLEAQMSWLWDPGHPPKASLSYEELQTPANVERIMTGHLDLRYATKAWGDQISTMALMDPSPVSDDMMGNFGKSTCCIA